MKTIFKSGENADAIKQAAAILQNGIEDPAGRRLGRISN